MAPEKNTSVGKMLRRLSTADLLVLYRAGGPYVRGSGSVEIVFVLYGRGIKHFQHTPWASVDVGDLTLNAEALEVLERVAEQEKRDGLYF